MGQWVSAFDQGDGSNKDLLGGKGANLAEMTHLGLPVPPGFTVTTEACRAYLASAGQFPDGLWEEVVAGIRSIEQQIGRT
ncbi:MAG TPA: PEP/pyruvate-binding domain-containing protein, partial [Thermomicrobiales bacterium]|nr:PEP/pyruvate-binding domain-containing protein [Thermomicrobiales bacterium]